ncbi:hypothetical protein J2Y73_004066 [Peribacillus frigoritolerans]|nr:hypothetical protein [Peribacillus frigoritolerans]
MLLAGEGYRLTYLPVHGQRCHGLYVYEQRKMPLET